MRERCFPSLGSFTHQVISNAIKNLAKKYPIVQSPAGSPQRMILVDATCGNGHDTCFLAKCMHETYETQDSWHMLAFDVQKQGIDNSTRRIAELEGLLSTKLLDKIRFIHQGHEFIQEYLTGKKISVAMFNLGYLPGSDKKITTRPESTLHSLKQMLNYFIVDGVISVHSYAGHTGGERELRVIEKFFCQLPSQSWQVARYNVCNKDRNPEVLFIAQRIET